MRVEHVEVLVEEPSMEAALRVILPNLLGNVSFEVYPHQGKYELLNRLPDRLRGYRAWLPQNWRIVVVVDRDDDNCLELKRKLEKIAENAGLKTRSKSDGQLYVVLNRLVIEELEAWYFGDWEAVQSAYPRVKATIPNQAKYRDSDRITGGTWEALERILKKVGYFKSGLRKIEAARAIAKHMTPERNRSRSFQALRSALLELGNSSTSIAAS